MIIRPFHADDVALFLQLAAGENWMADPWEFESLLSRFPHGCFTAIADSGDSAGFVTSWRHERSGWIGNLIVAEGYRRRGLGDKLFTTALEALRAAGTETVWLTASASGQALYEKHGFTAVDTIIRWTGRGRQRHAGHEERSDRCASGVSVSSIDHQAWGDRRDALLLATVARGRLLLEESGFAVVQQWGETLQIGPFSVLDDSTAESLLNDVLHTIPWGTEVCLDAPASNRSALRLFNRKKMRASGRNELMYAGVKPAYRAEYLYGLATMGSCG